jgi:Nucleotidyltransferase domain
MACSLTNLGAAEETTQKLRYGRGMVTPDRRELGYPSSLPASHAAFLSSLVERMSQDSRVVGILAGGSYLTNAMDQYSDLDLVIAVEEQAYAALLLEREALAASLGRLLASFTGEHVGEPRLLICLYEEPLLHVDLKFVVVEDLAERVEEPAVLWQRDDRIDRALAAGVAEYPTPDARWLERRFWVWVHYTASKIGRGELFDALHSLDYLRCTVLGPLGLLQAGARPSGVRRVETAAPELARRLQATVSKYDAADCLRGLQACVDVYRWLRAETLAEPSAVEVAAMGYLRGLGFSNEAP